jgi:hypothetical protein
MSKKYKRWTSLDVDFVVRNKGLKDKEVASQLSLSSGEVVTPQMVRRQRRKSGIHKLRGRPKNAPPEAITINKENLS